MSASPSKRPRLAGSFSPSSPPYHLAKAAEQAIQPNTPTSPPYMSTISNANGESSSASNIQRSDGSPSSAATMSQTYHFSQPGAVNTLLTPASSVAGPVSFVQSRDTDGDVLMGEGTMGDALRASEGPMGHEAEDAKHRRTDHDRQRERASSAAQRAMESYPFICQKPITPSKPWHVSANTLHEYGLDGLVHSVLRHDPVTGEKINKLRKTYKIVLQDLKLPGRTDPVVQRDQFGEMYRTPDDWWQTEVVRDHDLSQGFEGLMPNLDKALKMDSVKLPPETEKDVRKTIGADDSKKKSKIGTDGAVKPASHVPTPTAGTAVGVTSMPNGVQPSGAPSPAMRPSRPGTKRRYNDASFKGYGEGYADDDMGDSTAGEDDSRNGASKKKRRKENYSAASGGLLGPPQSYSNVGIVGSIRR